MPLHMPIHILQHLHLIVELVANLHAQFPLPPDAVAQAIQLLVLLPQHALVVRVDLPVVQRAVIRRQRIGVVAVGEQSGAVGRFGVVGAAGAGVVVKAHRLGRVRVGRVGGGGALEE